jgi:hypothetical protein
MTGNWRQNLKSGSDDKFIKSCASHAGDFESVV